MLLHLYYWPALDISSCFHPSWKCNFWINQHLFVQEHNKTITFRQFWELIVVIINFSKSFSQTTFEQNHIATLIHLLSKFVFMHIPVFVGNAISTSCKHIFFFIMHSGNLRVSIPFHFFLPPHIVSHKISCCLNKRSKCFCNIVSFLGNDSVNFQYFYFFRLSIWDDKGQSSESHKDFCSVFGYLKNGIKICGGKPTLWHLNASNKLFNQFKTVIKVWLS